MLQQPYPPVQKVATDTPATVALVLGIAGVFTFGLTSVAGIIVAHLTRANTPTRGLSTAALIVSYAVTGAFAAILAVLLISWLPLLFAGGDSSWRQ